MRKGLKGMKTTIARVAAAGRDWTRHIMILGAHTSDRALALGPWYRVPLACYLL
jgi:hypothetical protein